MIQFQVPGHLASPADLKFEQECLTPEETEEEHGINSILPMPYNPKYHKLKPKHATHTLATAIHFVLRWATFTSKESQNNIADLFQVNAKKLYTGITGHMYEPGQKLTMAKKAAKAATVTLTVSSTTPKKAKEAASSDEPKDAKDVSMDQDQGQQEATIAKETHTINTDDELPDPFVEKEPKFSDATDDDVLTGNEGDSIRVFKIKDSCMIPKNLKKTQHAKNYLPHSRNGYSARASCNCIL